MSASNGVIRIGRKGIKKFAFGETGEPFEVDVVEAFQGWLCVHESFEQQDGDKEGQVLSENMQSYYQAAVQYVEGLACKQHPEYQGTVSRAEALDFLARLREQYDELADFFRPKRRGADESPASSEPGLQFSEEPPLPAPPVPRQAASPTSTN